MDENIEVGEKPRSKVWIVLIIVMLVITAIVIYIVKLQPKKDSNSTTSNSANTDGPPLLIKSMPVKFAPYDPATGMAGDFKFTKADLQFDALYMDYAFEIPASPDYPAKRNPQPTFILPLGTKVTSMVDGEVIEITKLYSNDYSVMVGASKESTFRYETEHVLNPIIKVGDKVKAGDVIAEVSDFSSGNQGFGMVEMGILKGGNPPRHMCPFLYLDPAVKDKITNDLKTFYSDWNTYKGKTIYNLADYKTIGCLIEEENIEDNNNSATGNTAR